MNNGGNDAKATYDLTIDKTLLNRYDFRIDGASINDNFSDLGNGKVRFGGTVKPPFASVIKLYLKEDLNADVSDDIKVEFFNPSLPASSSQLGKPVKTVEKKIMIAVRGNEKYGDARTVPQQLGTPGFDEQFIQGLMGFAYGIPVSGSTTAQGQQIPNAITEIFAGGYGWSMYSPMKAFPDFPCGAGTYGYTVCPAPANDLPEPDGVDYTFLVLIVDADIPLDDPTNYYTYSFVFDTDGNTFNDWVPDPAFPNDFFQGTDRWYEVSYSPADGWELIVSQVTDGASRIVTRGVPTAANAMIINNTVSLVVPDSEIGATKGLSGVGVRYTSFEHTGDYGLTPPYNYSADTEPKVDEGLYRFE